IVIVSVGVVIADGPVVIGESAGPRALDVRHRVEGLQLFRDGIDPTGGDDVVFKLYSSGSRGQVSCGRIVDALEGAVRVQGVAEITVPQRRVGHGVELKEVL